MAFAPLPAPDPLFSRETALAALQHQGWDLVSRTSDKILLRKIVGVNGYAATALMLLFGLLGLLVVSGWIALRGTYTLTLREGSAGEAAALSGRGLSVPVWSAADLDEVPALASRGWRVGYGAALLIGLLAISLNGLVMRLLL